MGLVVLDVRLEDRGHVEGETAGLGPCIGGQELSDTLKVVNVVLVAGFSGVRKSRS